MSPHDRAAHPLNIRASRSTPQTSDSELIPLTLQGEGTAELKSEPLEREPSVQHNLYVVESGLHKTGGRAWSSHLPVSVRGHQQVNEGSAENVQLHHVSRLHEQSINKINCSVSVTHRSTFISD